MTVEEAIDILQNHTQYKCNGEDLVALDMAIEALEQGLALDRIRTEIEFEVDHRTNMVCAEDVLEIIDRYNDRGC